MKIRLTIIATAAALGFSFAASAAPVSQPVQQGLTANSQGTLSLVHSRRHNRRNSHWRQGPFCLFSVAPWCWR
jgi:hypothetical protein